MAGQPRETGDSMKLTQAQGVLITDYLRDVSLAMGETLPKTQRDQALNLLRTDIFRELEEYAKDRLEDGEVQSVLDRFGPPEIQARAALPRPAGKSRSLLDKDHRVWLGVCGGLAAKLGIEAWIVRLAGGLAAFAGPVLSLLTIISLRDFSSVTLGLFTFSAAMTGYLAAFVYMYFASDHEALPRVALSPIVANVGVTIVIAVALHLGAGYGIELLRYAHTEFLRRPLPPLGHWGWIEAQAASMVFWTLACCVPLAVLGGLPLPNQWNVSLKRLGQAGLALYGVALAFGVASFVVGAILDLVQNFGGTEGLLP